MAHICAENQKAADKFSKAVNFRKKARCGLHAQVQYVSATVLWWNVEFLYKEVIKMPM